MNTKKLARISGVSVRTLHYYDKIGLLSPSRNPENDYREYSAKDVDLLQQILFYKACGVELLQIKDMVYRKNYDSQSALRKQKAFFQKEKQRVEAIIATIDKTLLYLKGEYTMKNEEKFQALKNQMVEENEEKYGSEIREKYGEKQIDRSNQQAKNMTQVQYAKMEALSAKIKEILASSLDDSNTTLKVELAHAHKEWLLLSWGDSVEYSKEAHLSLCNMYLADSRFADYYGGEAQVIYLKSAIEETL